MVYLPDYVEYQYVPGQPFKTLFPTATDDCLDLLSKMFTYDPKARISAQQALEHRYVYSSSCLVCTLAVDVGSELFRPLGTSHQDRHLRNQLCFHDLPLSESLEILRCQISIHMMVLWYCLHQESQEE